ncbi:hypothetical protein GCM10023214_58260 [Amycolatopsis dongchuanensis]|uniref:Ribosomal protein mS38 C-terminal domain-containing protein n=1 Tax=Amycolatopsis dongchuanensis TaxID=1070866 RepID=A0ABP8VDB7_9PSEU
MCPEPTGNLGDRSRLCAPTDGRCAGQRRIDGKREGAPVGSVIKKRRKRMSKKKHRKLLRRTRMQRRKQGK